MANEESKPKICIPLWNCWIVFGWIKPTRVDLFLLFDTDISGLLFLLTTSPSFSFSYQKPLSVTTAVRNTLRSFHELMQCSHKWLFCATASLIGDVNIVFALQPPTSLCIFFVDHSSLAPREYLLLREVENFFGYAIKLTYFVKHFLCHSNAHALLHAAQMPFVDSQHWYISIVHTFLMHVVVLKKSILYLLHTVNICI